MTGLLFDASVGLRQVSQCWFEARDANPQARELFDRHYSRYVYADGRKPAKFIGPGQYMLLMDLDCKAIFAWRKFISADGQEGINCAIFRNESAIKSSVLIAQADELADARWPGERHFTYVNPRSIRSSNPGCCFKKCGYKLVGVTKARKLLIFAKEPRGQTGQARPLLVDLLKPGVAGA